MLAKAPKENAYTFHLPQNHKSRFPLLNDVIKYLFHGNWALYHSIQTYEQLMILPPLSSQAGRV
jgi:hypothetical protein